MKTKDLIIFTLLIIIPVLPKVNIISQGKIDDILYLFFIPFILIYSLKASIKRSKIFFIGLMLNYVIFFTMISSFHGIVNLEFTIRYLMYYLAFFAGVVLSHFRFEERLLEYIYYPIYINFFIGFLQKLELIGGSIDGIYRSKVSERVMALSSHPTEMGLIILLYESLIFIKFSKRRLNGEFYLLTLSCLILLMLTGSRTALILFIIFLIYFFSTRDLNISKKLLKNILIPIIVISLIFIAPYISRLGDAMDIRNVYFISNTLSDTNIKNINFSAINPELAPDGVDKSLYIRIIKWSSVLHEVQNQYPLTGYGFGYYGAAIDGYFMRVYGESGILGLINILVIFALLLLNSRKNKYIFIFNIMIILNCFTIDAVLFSRFAYMFWFLNGLYGGVKNERDSNNNSDSQSWYLHSSSGK